MAALNEELEGLDEEEMGYNKFLLGYLTKIGDRIKGDVKKDARQRSLQFLNALRSLSINLCKPDRDFTVLNMKNVVIEIPAETTLFRSYPRTHDPITNELVRPGMPSRPTRPDNVLFCNSTPLSNFQIGNKTVNDTMAILVTQRPLRLFNFIPLSMLFGAQVKAGQNGRGIFADCCEYQVIMDFCREHNYDGIVQTDSADMYQFESNDRLDPSLHTGTPTRNAMNARVLEDLTTKRAFPSFSVGMGINLVGAIYPEMALCDRDSVRLERRFAFEPAYANKIFMQSYTVPHLIPTNLSTSENWVSERADKNFDISPTILKRNELLSRARREAGAPHVEPLPYLFDRRHTIKQALEYLTDLEKIYVEDSPAPGVAVVAEELPFVDLPPEKLDRLEPAIDELDELTRRLSGLGVGGKKTKNKTKNKRKQKEKRKTKKNKKK